MSISARTAFTPATTKKVWNMRNAKSRLPIGFIRASGARGFISIPASAISSSDNIERAEQEFLDGIRLAEAIGENRALSLFTPNLAVVQAKQGRYDEALQTASTNLQSSSPSLLYSHFEALRCLAEVRFRRGELEEAEKICREADELISPTDSRVTQLWLGPLYIQVLLAAQKRAEAAEKINRLPSTRRGVSIATVYHRSPRLAADFFTQRCKAFSKTIRLLCAWRNMCIVTSYSRDSTISQPFVVQAGEECDHSLTPFDKFVPAKAKTRRSSFAEWSPCVWPRCRYRFIR